MAWPVATAPLPWLRAVLRHACRSETLAAGGRVCPGIVYANAFSYDKPLLILIWRRFYLPVAFIGSTIYFAQTGVLFI